MGYIYDIYQGLSTALVGMKITLAYWLRPGSETTEQYPRQKAKLYPRFRGELTNEVEKCIGDGACARVCPVDCIWLATEPTETNKRRISQFDLDLSRCLYCGLCVRVCPMDCLTVSQLFEGASYEEAGLKRSFGVGFLPPEEKARIEELKKREREAAAAKAREAKEKKAAKPAGEGEGAPEKKP